MDAEEAYTDIRPRTASFRSTQSGFVHSSGSVNQSTSSYSDESSSSNTTSVSPSHAIHVKHLDDEELSSWRDLVMSLDAEKAQEDLYSRPVRSRNGNFGGGSGEPLTKSVNYSRPPVDAPICAAIGDSSSMDLLVYHLKHDTTAQMAQFLKEKACIVDEDQMRAGPSLVEPQTVRGVKRPAAVVDLESQSDGELEDGMAD